jgi:intraflagellar transport protein 52
MTQVGATSIGRDQQPTICFDSNKRQTLLPTKGFKQLHRKLKQACKVDLNKAGLTLEKMAPFDVYIIAAPQEALLDHEEEAIRQYLNEGGSVLLALGEGGEEKYSHLNAFLEPFGVQLNEDCVVRTVIHNYLHPKEVCITNGVTNREFNRAAGKAPVGGASFGATLSGTGGSDLAAAAAAATASDSSSPNLTFVYPHGLTMNVQRPSVPVLSSGFMAYPLNRPIASVWESPTAHPETKKRGKLLVMGSALSFEDAWIGKEENDKLVTVVFDYLLHRLKLDQIDADDPDITDYHYLPDTASLADRLRVAVEESDELPRDFTQLYDVDMFRFDTNMIPEVIAMHEHLNVKHEPLSLIHPEFQAPLPPRLPATFDPTHRELPPPALDLFDLDDQFASEKVRLSQLTNKANEASEGTGGDLEFFILEGAEIMGVTKKLRSPRNKDPRALLDYIFRQVVQCKKNNHEFGDGEGARREPVMQEAQAGNVRIFRIVADQGGMNDSTPFDNNVPWAMTLEVDFASGAMQGGIALQSGSPNFPAQEAPLRGGVRDGQLLQWSVEVTNVVGNVVRFDFESSVQQQQPGQAVLNGHVAWGEGQSTGFNYVAEENAL